MLPVAPPSEVASAGPIETLIASEAPVVQVQKPPVITYVEPPEQPNQKAIAGVRFDFNFGCRIALDPDPSGQTWSVKFKDLETGNVIVDSQMAQGVIHSTKKYYIPFRIEVSLGEKLEKIHSINLWNNYA